MDWVVKTKGLDNEFLEITDTRLKQENFFYKTLVIV